MSETIAKALVRVTRCLADAGVDSPERDARLLVAHAAGLEAGRLTLHLPDPFEAPERLEAALAAREARQPVSQIVGSRLFWGRRFRVTPDVLDPRPETESLIALALEHSFHRVLDLGSGTGCILLTLLAERPSSFGVGVDLSEAALAVARSNAEALGVDADLQRSDWYADVSGRFDLIVSNPPYISAAEMKHLAPEPLLWEPRMALTDEGDGLACYRTIAAGAPRHLSPGGRLLVEIGPTQGKAVADLFSAAGLEDVQVGPDLDGRDRIVSARAALVE